MCPDKEDIFPCECTMEVTDLGKTEGLITCGSGFVSRRSLSHSVTQKSIDKTFLAARQVNNLTSPHQRLHLFSFTLTYSLLTQLDLTPLLNVKMNHFTMNWNYNLSSLVGPPMDSNLELIEVNDVQVHDNPSLTDSSLVSMLKYFNPDELTSFLIFRSSFTGNLNSEFLPGLSNFRNLYSLGFRSDKIKSLSGGPFKRNHKLRQLNLRLNVIEYLGEDAFVFDEPPTELKNKTLLINLSKNKDLTANSFHPNSGLDRIQRPVALNLNTCNISTLPAQIFEKFLEAHPGNSLSLYVNPLVCDSRLKWLKDRAGEFKNRVEEAYCKNDRGSNIFNSNLI